MSFFCVALNFYIFDSLIVFGWMRAPFLAITLGALSFFVLTTSLAFYFLVPHEFLAKTSLILMIGAFGFGIVLLSQRQHAYKNFCMIRYVLFLLIFECAVGVGYHLYFNKINQDSVIFVSRAFDSSDFIGYCQEHHLSCFIGGHTETTPIELISTQDSYRPLATDVNRFLSQSLLFDGDQFFVFDNRWDFSPFHNVIILHRLLRGQKMILIQSDFEVRRGLSLQLAYFYFLTGCVILFSLGYWLICWSKVSKNYFNFNGL